MYNDVREVLHVGPLCPLNTYAVDSSLTIFALKPIQSTWFAQGGWIPPWVLSSDVLGGMQGTDATPDVDATAAAPDIAATTVTPDMGIARGDAQLPPDGKLVVPADGLCFYHCMVAALDVASWQSLPHEQRLWKANHVKSELIQHITQRGEHETAARLQLPEVDGYPGQDEFQ
jgi:hypothetical protein